MRRFVASSVIFRAWPPCRAVLTVAVASALLLTPTALVAQACGPNVGRAAAFGSVAASRLDTLSAENAPQTWAAEVGGGWRRQIGWFETKAAVTPGPVPAAPVARPSGRPTAGRTRAGRGATAQVASAPSAAPVAIVTLEGAVGAVTTDGAGTDGYERTGVTLAVGQRLSGSLSGLALCGTVGTMVTHHTAETLDPVLVQFPVGAVVRYRQTLGGVGLAPFLAPQFGVAARWHRGGRRTVERDAWLVAGLGLEVGRAMVTGSLRMHDAAYDERMAFGASAAIAW